MALSQYDVQALFAEPYFRANVGSAISPDQVEFIKNLAMARNQSNLISENLYIFDEPELASVKEAVHEALNVFATSVMGIRQQLYVTQSWSLINEPSVGMHGHSHSNSIVSGSLYYTDLPEPVSGMVFDKHRSYQQLDLRPEKDRQNIFNTTVNILRPKKGEVFLFSSGLQHYVEPNISDQPRYSIAFNSFVRGKIGDHRDVSELTLS
ncbi:MAG: putative 2OG-Fe(II) oxygenase [Pseudomonadota bacterium]